MEALTCPGLSQPVVVASYDDHSGVLGQVFFE